MTQLFVLIASLTFAHASDMRVLSMLNEFAAEATPGANDPAFRTLTDFMDHARTGGTLKLAYGEPMLSIFPTAIRNGDFRPRAPLAPDYIFETLMTQDPRRDDYSIYPLVLRELRATADLCRIHVDLNPAARFSDGSPLRTADVRFSLEKFNTEFFSGAMAALVHRTGGKPVMTDLTDLSFEVQFTEIEVPKCRQAAFYFLNGIPLIKTNPAGRPSAEVEMPFIGSGPYLVDHAERALMRYRRNPEYWARDHERRRHTFNPDQIEVRVFMDPLLERFALLRGEINLMRESHFNYDAWMAKQIAGRPIRRVDQHSDGLATEVGAVWMNQGHEHTGNVEFRRALLLAWDTARADHDFYADRRHALAAPGLASRLYPRGEPSAAVLRLLNLATDDPNYPRTLGPMDRMDYEQFSKPKGTRQRLRLALDQLNRAGYAFARKHGRTVLTKDGRAVELTAIVRLGSPELKLFLRFQNELRYLGITLNIRELGDRSALVAALQSNQYDLYPGGVSIARDFTVINASYLTMELHSSSADGLGAWGRVRSKLIDVTIEELEKRLPSDADYPVAVEAFLRAFNANVPILPSGELDPVVTYHYDDVRVWGNRDRDLWTLYIKN